MPEIEEIRLIAPDGSITFAASIDEAIATPGSHHVELTYRYGPGLLPEPGDGQGLWRYHRLLPLAPTRAFRYPLQAGGTPLVSAAVLGRELGLAQLHLKDETRGPSGSNKDRATALVLEYGLREGRTTVTCASTGNVASSLAIGAAAAGMRAVICVPAGTSPVKLRLMLAAGADVVEVSEGYTAAFDLSREAARAYGWLDRNTGVNPLTTEAKKTVAFEIWEQFGRAMPDVVVAPVGDGPTIAALAKGFRELLLCGAVGSMPRLIGVQSAGLDPLVRKLQGRPPLAPGEGGTVAEGIAVPEPVSAAVVLRDVRESLGTLLSVADEDILRAGGLLLTRAGICAEPAGAAALAGLIEARRQGLVERDERVVALVTGSGLKTPEVLASTRAVRPVHADLEALREALDADL